MNPQPNIQKITRVTCRAMGTKTLGGVQACEHGLDITINSDHPAFQPLKESERAVLLFAHMTKSMHRQAELMADEILGESADDIIFNLLFVTGKELYDKLTPEAAASGAGQ